MNAEEHFLAAHTLFTEEVTYSQDEDSHYAIEFDQDKILEDLLAKEVMIEYKGDTVTVDDIFASFK